MTYPAFDAFADDDKVRRVPFRVYMRLKRERLNFLTPVEVKVTELAETMHIRPASVIAALNWLTGKGYLVEHGRGERNQRNLTLAWSIQSSISKTVHTHQASS